MESNQDRTRHTEVPSVSSHPVALQGLESWLGSGPL